MVLAMPLGIRFCTKYASSEARKVLNSGKVVKIAKAIVNTGTSASTVVKVRLPATCGNCSSARRRPAKRNRSRTCGQVSSRKKVKRGSFMLRISCACNCDCKVVHPHADAGGSSIYANADGVL